MSTSNGGVDNAMTVLADVHEMLHTWDAASTLIADRSTGLAAVPLLPMSCHPATTSIPSNAIAPQAVFCPLSCCRRTVSGTPR
jgi:hypothetical protein